MKDVHYAGNESFLFLYLLFAILINKMYAFYRTKFLLLIIIVLVYFHLSALAGYTINSHFLNWTFKLNSSVCCILEKSKIKFKTQLIVLRLQNSVFL